MNKHLYRVIFNRALNLFQVVAENTRQQGKGAHSGSIGGGAGERVVTLEDGTRTKVLVPQVYVRVRAGDLNGNGTLMAGATTELKLTNDLFNSGTIAGRMPCYAPDVTSSWGQSS